ncbi:MAG: flagellar biosynthetic protein FliR [Desulfobulbus propionicus]|nr:MAG: flagellar biosynthetic protein FliR [Desulfobulbus propionicus]
MDPLIVPIDQFQNFLLCFSRTVALVAAVPALAGVGISMRLKVSISFLTALLLFPLMKQYTPIATQSMLELGFLLVNEVILGLLISLTAQLIFAGISFGGTIVGYQMGFAAANILDPQTTQQLSLVSQFINVFAMLIFFSFNMHYYFFHVIVESYRVLPPGYLDFSGQAVPKLMTIGSHMFVLGIKFCAPILILLLLSSMVLGVLARVFPQLNVFMLSFPVNIGTAFIVMSLTLGVISSFLRREFDNIIPNIVTILDLLKK